MRTPMYFSTTPAVASIWEIKHDVYHTCNHQRNFRLFNLFAHFDFYKQPGPLKCLH